MQITLVVLFAVFVWWLSTGLVFFAASLPESTRRFSLWSATAGMVFAFYLVWLHAGTSDALSALMGFAAAIVIWGWCELTFLFGLITGPNRKPCPDGARGGRRFGLAASALIYHELALLAAGGAVYALSGDAGLPVAFMTFALLWGLRLSAKLNLFFGAPAFDDDLVPEPMRYLSSYFGKARFHPGLPLALIAGSAMATVFIRLALGAAGDFERVGYTLLSTLVVLGVFEHAMMLLPLRDSALWDAFALPKRENVGDKTL